MSNVFPANILNTVGEIKTEGSVSYLEDAMVSISGYSFDHTYSNLAAGATVYTPAVGDVIYDIAIALTTAFNGTTPKLDVGTFNGGTAGLFKELAGNPVDGTKLYAAVTDNAGLTVPNTTSWLQAAVGSVGAAGTAAYISTPIIVTAANPILLVASQDGTKGGTATGATAGAGFVYVVSASVIDPCVSRVR